MSQRFERSWPLEATAVQLARIHARTWLSTWSWEGDHDRALTVVGELVDNAVTHAEFRGEGVVRLVLLVADSGELLIDVMDPDPDFPDFAQAVNSGSRTSGIGFVRGLGGEITWGVPDAGGGGKCVRVRLSPTPA
ncbi:ATP-binding protein [Streptomyces acidiscabies]|uniref:ATP-binding protein n=1 Tax=Streptomyces acidiscabies TaxID=42234 RepID=UPI00117F9E1A|nr:ATP-binding protein [Streptomyces acidiscabies]